jgi:hypothetical protein
VPLELSTVTDRWRGRFPPAPGRALDYALLALLAAAISLSALLHFYRQGEILLYGDAISHINIARRIADSRTPGPLQLGTVWLPLPHILMFPLLLSDWAWRTGLGGSVPSMLAYILATLGIFRLVRHGLNFMGAPARSARMAAWTAAAIFAANPGLIYLQSTAMTESLSLAAFVWAAVFFGQFVENVLRYSEFAPQPDPRDSAHAGRALLRCGWCLMAFMLIRYDGWFAALAFVVAASLVFILAARRRGFQDTYFVTHWKWRSPLFRFLLMVAAVPVLWFAYNAAAFEGPLAFASGPYSAQAIERQTREPGDPRHPGWHAPHVGAAYVLKAAKLNLGEWNSSGATFFPAALLGTGILLLAAPALSYWLLLWIPLLSYSVSIAWAGVPLFIPTWWPFSYYNLRYGIQLLPAVAVFTSVALYFALALVRSRSWRVVLPTVIVSLVAACYAQAWAATPIVLREARVNSSTRLVLERALAWRLRDLPAGATLLMHISGHGRALQLAGIPFRRTLNEGDRKDWPRALAAPARSAAYVIAAGQDPVSEAVRRHPEGLVSVAVVEAPGQDQVTIYRSLHP